MFYIVEIQGCEPYVDIIRDPTRTGEATAFDTKKQAERYAKKNCAWEYQIVEFN